MPGIRGILATSLLTAAVGCTAGLDLDEIPLGAAVQVMQEDGGLVEGRLLDRTPDSVTIDEGLATRDVARQQVAELRVVSADEPMPAPPPEAIYRRVVVPSGTTLRLELEMPVDSQRNAVGDPVSATLAEAVKVDEMIVLPKGSRVTGRVAALDPAATAGDPAAVTLTFKAIAAGDEAYDLESTVMRAAPFVPVRDASTAGAELRLAAKTTLEITLDTPLDVVVPIVRNPGR
jgi:hypothetical protein